MKKIIMILMLLPLYYVPTLRAAEGALTEAAALERAESTVGTAQSNAILGKMTIAVQGIKAAATVAWRYTYVEAKALITDFIEEVSVRMTATSAAQKMGKDIAKILSGPAGKAFTTDEVKAVLSNSMKAQVESVLSKEGKSLAPEVLDKLVAQQTSRIFYTTMTLPGKILNNSIFQMAIMMAIMSAYGIDAQWVSDADQTTFNNLQQQQQQLSTSYSNFVNDFNQKQLNVNQKATAGFLATQQLIASQYDVSGQAFQQALINLNKSISLTAPKQLFLVDYVMLDQIFANSTMLTPVGQSWYNLFQYGDWEYDPDQDIFIQYQTVPFYTKDNPDNPEYAQNNSIFTEYVSDQKSYSITVQCTLHAVTYPFFVGLAFNRARWISGDPERLRQYRLLGLYGSANQALSFCYAENKIAGTGSNVTITSPMKQIVSASTPPLATLSSGLNTTLANSPITFTFDLAVEPQSVKGKISSRSKELNIPISLDSLNPLLFLYGGIGFMAAGCRAEFKILKPSNIRYTKTAIATFKTQRTNMLNQTSSTGASS